MDVPSMNLVLSGGDYRADVFHPGHEFGAHLELMARRESRPDMFRLCLSTAFTLDGLMLPKTERTLRKFRYADGLPEAEYEWDAGSCVMRERLFIDPAKGILYWRAEAANRDCRAHDLSIHFSSTPYLERDENGLKINHPDFAFELLFPEANDSSAGKAGFSWTGITKNISRDGVLSADFILRPLNSRETVPPFAEAENRFRREWEQWLEKRRRLSTSGREDAARLRRWGFELIKYDFTSCDLFGRWGFDFDPFPATEGSWTFRDRSRTSAEIILDLYTAILDASDGALRIGCNTFGHLGAGRMHISRTGDDTSGKDWAVTRKMGVNTLAFRLCQHNAFFALDADCAGITPDIPWEFNARWLRLLAISGNLCSASVRPRALNRTRKNFLREIFRTASKSGNHAEPLDWLDNPVPENWKTEDSPFHFSWFQE